MFQLKIYQNSIIYDIHQNFQSNEAYIFDLDGTIIKTKSGKKFAKDIDDWKYLNDNTYEMLKDLSQKGNIIIMTNQKGISKKKLTVKEFNQKINAIFKNIPNVSIFAAIQFDRNRKPLTGTYEFIISQMNDINIKWYMGDAAGRLRDHSSDDRFWALNNQIAFKLPNDNKSRELPDLTDYHKNVIGNTPISDKPFKLGHKKIKNKRVYMLIGFPGSGKSYLASKLELPNVNRDILKTKSKQKNIIKEYVSKSLSFVIDNTNLTLKQRLETLEEPKKHGYKIYYIHFDYNIKLCKHLNFMRCQLGGKCVPEIAYRVLKKKYVPPNKSKEPYEKLYKIPLYKNIISKKEFNYYYI